MRSVCVCNRGRGSLFATQYVCWLQKETPSSKNTVPVQKGTTQCPWKKEAFYRQEEKCVIPPSPSLALLYTFKYLLLLPHWSRRGALICRTVDSQSVTANINLFQMINKRVRFVAVHWTPFCYLDKNLFCRLSSSCKPLLNIIKKNKSSLFRSRSKKDVWELQTTYVCLGLRALRSSIDRAKNWERGEDF